MISFCRRIKRAYLSSLKIMASMNNVGKCYLNWKFPNGFICPECGTKTYWVFFCFHGVDMLTINQEQSLVVNLQERHDIILQLLGQRFQFYYS